jgi:superfamily II DNA/RNA helicase
MEELVEGVDLPEDVSVEVITGGVPLEPQVSALARRQRNNENLDILIATPGRLADVLLRSTKEDSTEKELESKLLAALDSVNDGNDVSLSLAQLDNFKINESIASGDDGGRSAIKGILSTVRFLVIDEADRLLSQGFKKEVDNVLNLLPRPNGSNDPEGMKTLLFSATFPEQIQPRVEKVLQRLGGKDAPSPLRLSCTNVGVANLEPEQLSGRQQKRLALTTQPQTILEGPASTIKLRSIRLDEQDRTQALRRLLREYGSEEWDRVLVFVGTRYSAEHVAMKLRRYNIKATELHGKLDQDARTRRLNDFRSGKTQVLVATDLASRGLDVAGLAAVVNYDLPRSTTDFTQRIGRTGRAGNHGTAVSFITPSNEFQYDLIEKRHLNGIDKVEREILKGFEPNENKWEIISASKKTSVSGTEHSKDGLAHDQMFGGIKGRRKSKKDKLREKAARQAAKKASLN